MNRAQCSEVDYVATRGSGKTGSAGTADWRGHVDLDLVGVNLWVLCSNLAQRAFSSGSDLKPTRY